MDVSQIAQEIADLFPVFDGKHDDEVTIKEMSIAWNINLQAAMNKLDGLVASGKMTKRKASIDGRNCNVYRIAPGG